VVNLGNGDVMTHITKIVIVENTTAIWEYDSSLDNCILDGSLDVIAAIQTLTIKVSICMSHIASLTITTIKSRHLNNTLSTSRALRFDVDSPSH